MTSLSVYPKPGENSEKDAGSRLTSSCWIELSRASQSTRMPVDLTQITLPVAMWDYVNRHKIRPIIVGSGMDVRQVFLDPFTDLCRTHYEADDSTLIHAVRYTEIIIDLDYDSGKNRLENFQAAADAVKKLAAVFDKHFVPYRVYFSGSKGFHVTIPGAIFWPYNRETRRLEFIERGNLILRRMIRMICDEADVPQSVRHIKGNAGWDTSLYDLRRMVRIPGMPHGKSLVVSQEILGRTATIYKSWLPASWSGWSTREVVEWSTVVRPLPVWSKLSRIRWLEELWEQAVIANDADEADEPIVYKPSTMKTLTPVTPHSVVDLQGYPPCITSIRQGDITTMGLRNRIGIAVCSFHSSTGESVNDAIVTMQAVPSRSRSLSVETQSQWNSITTKAGNPKENYRFSNRSCRSFRGSGAACTDQCPLHAEFIKGEQASKRSLPSAKPYDWGSVDEVRLEDV